MRSSSRQKTRSGSNVLISPTVRDASIDANAVAASTASGSLPHPFLRTGIIKDRSPELVQAEYPNLSSFRRAQAIALLEKRSGYFRTRNSPVNRNNF
jgi:hypothetical protein